MAKPPSSHLLCHPSTPDDTVKNLAVSLLQLPDGGIQLCYTLHADLSDILLPALQTPSMADNLWQHTCFEVFIAVQDSPYYHEFNFAPSTRWAAYAFSEARQRCPWQAEHAPVINRQQTSHTLSLTVQLHAAHLPANPEHKALQLGLTAVLESQHNTLSYWALTHPAPQPDFHDRAGFILTLTPP